jgi:Fe-S-cluster containining protein
MHSTTPVVAQLSELYPQVSDANSMQNLQMNVACRMGCGACCIAPSISSPIPGMPGGKPAGVRCLQLDDQNRCALFGKPERPAVCSQLRPSPEMCGETREHALMHLERLESATTPRRDEVTK